MIFKTDCIRCGKTRISLKKWQEKTEKGPALMMEKTICPDAACQKVVDQKFTELREKKEALRAIKEENDRVAKEKAQLVKAAKEAKEASSKVAAK